MVRFQIRDVHDLRAINRVRAMEAFVRFGDMSRSQLSEVIGLSTATTAEVVTALMKDGLLVEGTRHRPARGRPTQTLSINRELGFVAGVRITPGSVAISLCDGAGTPIAVERRAVPEDVHADELAASVADGFRKLLDQNNVHSRNVLGLGLGVPGFYNAKAERYDWSPMLQSDLDGFASNLAAQVPVHILTENDANLIALAERWFGAGADVDDFIVITVEDGVGMGIFHNGDLYRSPIRLEAELGHLTVEKDGRLCRCGRRGCVEAYVADYALVANAGLTADGVRVEEAIRHMTHEAEFGNADYRAAFARAGQILGEAVANVAAILGPQKIILTGAAMRSGDLLGRAFVDAYRASALSALRYVPVITKVMDPAAPARGAAALILTDIYAGMPNRTT